MYDIEAITQQARILWQQGQQAEAAGDYASAYQLFTQAHDLVIPCPAYHKLAHVHLRRVNLKLGHYGELFTDWALHCLAPLGVFYWVAYFQQSSARFAEICRKAFP